MYTYYVHTYSFSRKVPPQYWAINDLCCLTKLVSYRLYIVFSVKVEVHSSSSGAGSDTNLSSPEISDTGKTTENEYEDIYVIKESTVGEIKTNGAVRRGSRDSGSHSRSESISSTNSNVIRVVSVLEEKLADNQDDFGKMREFVIFLFHSNF